MIINVTGTNRKLLQQYNFLLYKANKAADKNKWSTYGKYHFKAQRKLLRIAVNLKIDRRKYELAPGKNIDCIVLLDKEVQP